MAAEFEGLVVNVNDIENKCKRVNISAGKAATELALVEARLNKLQEKGVDSVQTGELGEAGRERAKR